MTIDLYRKQGMASSFNGTIENPVGKWTASSKVGRKLILVVHGILPAGQEKLSYSLKKANVQGASPLTLVLELSPDVALSEGIGEDQVYYSEILDRYDQYESILVRGNGRDLAFFDIETNV
jgi:hypothetical protein